MTLAALLPSRTHPLVIGSASDARALTGFSLPSDHLGARGRWSRGDGLVTLPAYPAPAVVSLSVAAPDERASDTIEVATNGVRVSRHTLARGMESRSTCPSSGRFSRAGSPIRIRSAVTPSGDGPARGVFLARVTLETGGVANARRTPIAILLPLSLAFLGIMAFAALLTRRPSGIGRSGIDPSGIAPRALVGGAIVLAAVAASIGFRTELLPRVIIAAALCWAAAAALAVAGISRVSALFERGSTSSSWRATLAFSIFGVCLIGLLMPDAWLKGYVLSQADMFFEAFPWRAHLPADYQAPFRAPLGDIPMMVYPFASFARSRWWMGVFPLWTNA